MNNSEGYFFFIENSNIVFSILNIEMHVVFCVVKMGILT